MGSKSKKWFLYTTFAKKFCSNLWFSCGQQIEKRVPLYYFCKKFCSNLWFICGQQIEKRVPLYYFCKKVKESVQYLIWILKKSEFQKYGQQFELFWFKENKFKTIDNLSLRMLWNLISKLKFKSGDFPEIKLSRYLKYILCQLVFFPPPLSLARVASCSRSVRYGA